MAADVAVFGARIRTMDPERPWAAAVAIADGVIVAVGDDAAVRDACDGATERIDGAGMHLTPGLTDSHFHAFLGADAPRGLDLTGVKTLDALRAALRAERRRVGPDAWVVGWGLSFEMFSATGIRGDLFADAVEGGLAYLGFFEGHTGVASPAALALGDVTGRETFEDFSTVVVDGNGNPTGELQEGGAINLVRDLIAKPTEEQRYRAYVEEIRIWNSLGITQIHNMDGTPATHDLLRRLEANGDLTIRMHMPLWQQPETTFAEMEAQLPLRDAKGRRWRGGAAKFFIDGVIESGTAWLVEPDTKGQGVLPFWPDPEKYRAAVALFAAAGFQCVTHAVGDMAVRTALDAYEATRKAGSAPGILHRVEHIELVQDGDVPRFAELGVVASMQPLHMSNFAADGSDEWGLRVGPERRRLAFRTRDLLNAGAVLALGSDWMVAPYDPRIGFAWAQLRRTPGCPELGRIEPRQALTGLETLAGYTTEAARTIGEEAFSGRIREGFRGDLSAFAVDIAECPPDGLHDVPTLLTVVDGEVVFRAEP